MKINERNNHVVPVKLNDNSITVTSGPNAAYVTINIDADVLTLGVAAKILAMRYKQHLSIFKRNNLIPADYDDMVKDMVDEYLGCNRTGIKMIRKENSNG